MDKTTDKLTNRTTEETQGNETSEAHTTAAPADTELLPEPQPQAESAAKALRAQRVEIAKKQIYDKAVRMKKSADSKQVAQGKKQKMIYAIRDICDEYVAVVNLLTYIAGYRDTEEMIIDCDSRRMEHTETAAVLQAELSAVRRKIAITAAIVISSFLVVAFTTVKLTLPLWEFEYKDGAVSYKAGDFGISFHLGRIAIPDDVTVIGSNAFRNTTLLRSITIPGSVERIEDEAFLGCSNLRTVIMADGMKSIGASAFQGCERLNEVSTPGTLIYIGDAAFMGCIELPDFDLPDGLTQIGESAFLGCLSLRSIHIPDSVVSVGAAAFQGCISMSAAVLPSEITCINESTFQACSNLRAIEIPRSVTVIGDYAFMGCASITEAVVPDGISVIPNGLFRFCSRLTVIDIPDSVTVIGNSAFLGCVSLPGITIPESVTSIGDYAFWNCSKMREIIVPSSVTQFGVRTFTSDFSALTIVCQAGSAADRFAMENSLDVRYFE